MSRLLIFLIQTYRIVISPHFGAACRFEPSCSRYGIEAIRIHGAWWGLWLTARRLLRCRPWGPSGFDPVPLLGHGCRKES